MEAGEGLLKAIPGAKSEVVVYKIRVEVDTRSFGGGGGFGVHTGGVGEMNGPGKANGPGQSNEPGKSNGPGMGSEEGERGRGVGGRQQPPPPQAPPHRTTALITSWTVAHR